MQKSAILLLLVASSLAAATPISDCQNFSTANSAYTLTQAVSSTGTCFNLWASNVTLDCGGFAVTGANISSTYGAYSNSTLSTIANCNILNYTYGIYLQGATYANVTGIRTNITRASGAGVYVSGGNSNNITNSLLNTTTGFGIALSSSSYNLVLNNTARVIENLSRNQTADYAIYLTGSSYNNVVNNTAISDHYYNESYGIYLVSSSNYNNITNNTAHSNGGNQHSIGIVLFSSANYNTLTNNNASGYSVGILLSAVSYNNFTGNNGTSYATSITSPEVSGSGIFIHLGSNYNILVNNRGSSIAGAGLNVGSRSGSATPNYNVLTNNTGISSSGDGLALTHSSTFNNFTGNYLTSNGTYVLELNSGPHHNLFVNNTAEGAPGLTTTVVWQSNNNTFKNHRSISTSTAAGGGFYVQYGSKDNKINDSFISTNSTVAVVLSSAGVPSERIFGNIFYNNTFNSSSGTLVVIENLSQNNTFFLNNFTNTSGTYFNDTTAGGPNSNSLYGVIDGKLAGNIWHNVINGSVNITGNDSSPFPGLYYGGSGPNYPYSAANSQGKLAGNLADYAPLTPYTGGNSRCFDLNIANTITTLTQSYQSNGTCIRIKADNVTLDCAGYNLTGSNISGTYGVFSTQFNTTIMNCNISNFSAGIYFSNATNGTLYRNNITTNYTFGYGICLSATNWTNSTNNTLRSPGGTGISTDTGSSNNSFLFNNVTSSVWVNDRGANDSFNSTTAGNIYYFANGSDSWAIYNIADTDGNGWADTGSARPFNRTNTASYWLGNGADWRPFTNQTALATALSVSISPTSPDTTSTLTCTAIVNNTLNESTTAFVEWYKNGTNQTALATAYGGLAAGASTAVSTVPPSNISEGDLWRCSVRAQFNATNSSVWMNSSNVTIAALQCMTINTVGANISMTADLSTNGAWCFDVEAENVTINCNGHTINGGNTAGSSGVTSYSAGTTVKNCIINGTDTGVYIDTGSNALLQNIFANVSGMNGLGDNEVGFRIYSPSSTTIINITGISGTSYGIDIETGSGLSINNSSGTSQSGYGIYFDSVSSSIFTNLSGTSQSGIGFYIASSNTNNFTNVFGSSDSSYGVYTNSVSSSTFTNVSGTSQSNAGIYLDSTNTNNFTNVSGSSQDSYGIYGFRLNTNNMSRLTAYSNTSGGLYFQRSSSNNISNSSFTSLADAAFTLTNSGLFQSSSNVVLQNNISGVTWVTDTGTNTYNDSAVGNIYYFSNGTPSWDVYNMSDNNGDTWADTGLDLPFGATNTAAYWPSNGEDNHPYTNRSSYVPPQPTNGTSTSTGGENNGGGNVFIPAQSPQEPQQPGTEPEPGSTPPEETPGTTPEQPGTNAPPKQPVQQPIMPGLPGTPEEQKEALLSGTALALIAGGMIAIAAGSLIYLRWLRKPKA